MAGKTQRKVSVSKIFQTIIDCAIISATSVGKRCRMSEIRFYVDLYAGFLLAGTANENVVIQSVQIMRILESLEAEKLVQITKEGSQTYYSAGARCFFYLLSQVLNGDQRMPMEEVIFLNYYSVTYRPLFVRSAKKLSDQERDAMIDILTPGRLVSRQIAIMDELIQRIEARRSDYAKIRAFLDRDDTGNLSTEEKIQRLPLGPNIPQTYKKSLRDVLLELPEPLRTQEITEGFDQRLKYYYEPYLATLRNERDLLVDVLKQVKANTPA